MFDGTIGDWNTDPVNLELKPDSKLFNFKYYPLLRINKKTFFKEIKRLVKIGVLTLVQKSQYGTPVFIIPKKQGTVMFITNYCMLKHNFVRKPYPLARIGDNIQHLEVSQYTTALEINMGYYNIRISPASQDMKTIVTKFGMFRYNRLPVGICASGNIFQSKVDEILSDIEVVKTYINDILVLSKY